MGVVFLGEHQRLVRRVAIKLLARELVRDRHALQCFFNEARRVTDSPSALVGGVRHRQANRRRTRRSARQGDRSSRP